MAESKNNWKGPQPAPLHFGRLLRANFPQITQTGIYNDRNIAGTSKKSAHAEGRALDIHLSANDPSQKSLGDQLYNAIIRKARCGQRNLESSDLESETSHCTTLSWP